MKRIIITNDDGINAGGIARLAAAARKFGEVWVVAPDVQKSGASQSVTFNAPVMVKNAEFPVPEVKAFAVSGTPADCARIGILSILPEKPDILLSGINFGYNAGHDVHYSGTIGAAAESVFQGVPAIAFSEGIGEGYLVTDIYLERILGELIGREAPPGAIWNVNFPYCRPEEVKGILYDRFVSKTCSFLDGYKCVEISETEKSYTVDGVYQENAEEGSDLKALFDHYISIGTYQ